MANQEQLEILKQGVEIWNKWREENRQVYVNFNGIKFKKGNFRGAKLGKIEFCGSDLREADFSEADLRSADFSRADLRRANFNAARLMDTEFTEAKLDEADLSYAGLGETILDRVDLSSVKGLETVIHIDGSNLGFDTLFFSQGNIPVEFLRGCGLSDWEIEATKLYNPNLTNQEIDEILYRVHDIRAHQPVQISPLFISYSHADSEFVDRIEKSLNARGIRFWRDIHQSTAGRLEKQIDRAIRHNPTVLVILSESSIESDWVEHEVVLARELEKEIKRDVLCPVALDDSWKTSQWSKVIMEQVKKYNILDFSIWEDDTKFEKMFNRLIDGLNLFYKKDM